MTSFLASNRKALSEHRKGFAHLSDDSCDEESEAHEAVGKQTQLRSQVALSLQPAR